MINKQQNDIYIPEIKSTVNVERINTEKGTTESSMFTFYFQNKEQYDVYLDCTKIGRILFNFDDYTMNTVMLNKYFKGFENTVDGIFNPYCINTIQNEDEVKVGYPVKLGTDHMRADYMSLMLEAEILLAIKTGKGVDYAYTQYERVTRWLQTKDFFIAPASTRFHDSEDGGLLKHSLKVYNYMCDLKNTDTFKDADVAEMTICALTHDWCKIGIYEPYMRNVKDEATGQWIQEKAYKLIESPYPFGHGETSMYIVNRFFKNLSIEASLAIRWHMDKYYASDALNDDLYNARAKYPLVLMLITADELSLTQY